MFVELTLGYVAVGAGKVEVARVMILKPSLNTIIFYTEHIELVLNFHRARTYQQSMACRSFHAHLRNRHHRIAFSTIVVT